MSRKVKEINIKEWIVVLKRRLWIIIFCCIVCSSLGWYLNSKPVTPLYEAETRLLIKGDSKSMQTVLNMIREPIVMERVAAYLELNRSPASLRNQISMSSVSGSQIYTLKVVDPDPFFAAVLANAAVDVYRSTLSEFLEWSDITILTPATADPHATPINPVSKRLTIAGMIGGLLLGIGAAFLRDSLDDTIRSKQEIESLLGVPVLGTVANIRKKDLATKERQKEVNLAVRGESIGS